MNVVRTLNAAGAVATIALLAACSADPSAPVALRPAPSLDVISTPGVRPERSLLICKNATNTIIADHFSYSVDVYQDGTGTFIKTVGPVDVVAGTCVDAKLGLAANAVTLNYRVNVTETVPQFYTVSGITAHWGAADGQTPPTINTAAAPQVAGLYVGHDLGSIVTFTNLFTPPSAGCTFTLGYWKTHNASFKGGAPLDPTWNLLPGGLAELTTFFLSGQTWFQAFNTAPAGNGYYILSQQYMAARLNVLSGASVPAAVGQAITDATALFNTYTPAQIGALKGSNTLRAQFIALAGTLGDYNTGATGPGHCE